LTQRRGGEVYDLERNEVRGKRTKRGRDKMEEMIIGLGVRGLERGVGEGRTSDGREKR